jgi:hypothetical protein
MAINFIPQELSALCLHEFGHTVYSEKTIEVFYNSYREYNSRLSQEDKASLKILYILNKVPLMLACGAHKWMGGHNGVGEEIFADTTVEELGYGQYLETAFEKILKTYGNSIGYTSDSAVDSAIKESIIWCNLNVHDMVKRKNNLKNELYYNTAKSDSGFVKKIMYSIMETIGIQGKNNYSGVIESVSTCMEQDDFLQNYGLVYNIKTFGFLERRYNDARDRASKSMYGIATESANGKPKYKIPNQLDVDSIYVEVDRISNHMDRKYVLDLIYNQIEKIETFQSLFDYSPDLKHKYATKMTSMLDELESLRQAVLEKRNFDTNYKVFVKYPDGYKG